MLFFGGGRLSFAPKKDGIRMDYFSLAKRADAPLLHFPAIRIMRRGVIAP